MEGYEREMQAQRERARAASRFGVDLRAGAQVAERSEFRGYEELESEGRVLALLRDGSSVESLQQGEHGEVVLDRTPFYAESGGQVGDSGELHGASGDALRGRGHAKARRRARASRAAGERAHRDRRHASLARVDAERREAIRLNHSATHLLHAALRRCSARTCRRRARWWRRTGCGSTSRTSSR